MLSLLAIAAAAAAVAPPPCAGPEFHQFDFWVGRWEVYAASAPDKKAATSVIEALYSGCAIRENWKPDTPAGGGSLSSYVADEKAWKQTWVDASGTRADFKGGWTGNAMVLTGVWPQPGHPTQMTRMTYTPLNGGAVRQYGETSDDQGKTWQPSFDFIYRPAAQVR
jgi:hypothetical protein